jgi:translation initiation factor IF-3
VASNATPPVCRLLNYGKFKYQQEKREHEARKSQKKSLQLKEVRLRPKIGEHDFEAKIKAARKMLADGAKVKVSVFFRGREISHPEQGWKLLQRVSELVKDVAVVERQPVFLGKMMVIILVSSAIPKPNLK